MQSNKIYVLFLTCLLGQPLFASSGELAKLDEKQAMLTRQASLIDKVSEIHARSILIRNQYISEKSGLPLKSKAAFESVDRWLENWLSVIEPLASSNWQQVLATGSLTSKLEQQEIALNQLEEVYRDLVLTARTGDSLTRELGRVSFNEFSNLNNSEFDDVVFLQNYSSNLKVVQNNIDNMQKVFADSNSVLTGKSNGYLIGSFRDFTNEVTENFKLLAKLSQLSFPELEVALKGVQKSLITMEVIAPLSSRTDSLFKEGLDAAKSLDIVEAEVQLGKIQEIYGNGFGLFVDNKNYDQERIKQERAFIKGQIDEIRRQIDIKIGIYGSKEKVLRTYIASKSAKGFPSNPEKSCKNAEDKYRDSYDCSLFRTGVYPFLKHLDDIEYGMLKLIEKNLKQVYLGPLAKKG